MTSVECSVRKAYLSKKMIHEQPTQPDGFMRIHTKRGQILFRSSFLHFYGQSKIFKPRLGRKRMQ